MLKKYRKGSCTTILAGKSATIDGSTLIARNDDGHEALDPQRFVVVQPDDQPRHYTSVISGCEVDLPDNPMRYTSTPNAILDEGIWAAAGINSANVGMSATETITTNPRIQGLDPFVETGLGEEDFVVLVLPYIHSAREGVKRLGALLEKYGTYEPNGIGFQDKDEVWWLETIGGHHWAAVRIPDDSIAVLPNRFNIDDFDFDSEDVMYSEDLKSLIDDNFLNPDFEGYNLRHIFGTSSIKDTVYNNPRTWYGQNFFGLESFDPFAQDLPFIFKADRKISVEDVKFIESSHYENTEFDPYGTTNTEAEKKLVRSIGLNRNHSLHILQIRNHVAEELAGVHWLAFGANSFNQVVPFYANVEDTPACYRDASATFDPTNIYWLSALTALVGDHNYDFYVDMRDNYTLKMQTIFRKIQNETDKLGKTADLAEANKKMASESQRLQIELLGEMTKKGSNKMTLRFDFND